MAGYEISTSDIKVVADYTLLKFTEVYELNTFDFWLFLKDGVIYNYSQTEEGRQYLKDAKRFTTTAPERNELQKFKKR